MVSPEIKRLPPSPGRTLVIGDVHGCAHELRTLIEAFSPRPGDRLIAAGDLINRGPDSPGVLKLVREHQIQPILGNHEVRLLTAFLGNNPDILKPRDRPTLEAIDPADWQWISEWPHILHIPSLNALVVHGGFDPLLDWREQDRSTLLKTQVLDAEGRPAKRSDSPSGIPWAAKWKGPEHVYYGHTPRPHPLLHPFATGLDTGCVYGYTLTAVSLPDFEFYRVHARRPYVGG
jgi:predicted phosphodiesterase